MELSFYFLASAFSLSASFPINRLTNGSTAYRRSCIGDNIGWFLDPQALPGDNFLYCDMSINPCHESCPFSRGRLPKTVSMSATNFNGPHKRRISSNCGELDLPGGMVYVPQACANDGVGCITHHGKPLACTSVMTEVPYPAEIFAMVNSEPLVPPTYQAIYSLWIVQVLALITLVVLVCTLFKQRSIRFSGYRVNVGSKRYVDISDYCTPASKMSYHATWTDRGLTGHLFTSEDDSIAPIGTLMTINPVVSFDHSQFNDPIVHGIEQYYCFGLFCRFVTPVSSWTDSNHSSMTSM